MARAYVRRGGWWVGVPWWLALILGAFVLAGVVAYFTVMALIYVTAYLIAAVVVAGKLAKQYYLKYKAKKALK